MNKATQLITDKASPTVLEQIRLEIRTCLELCETVNLTYVNLLTVEDDMNNAFLWYCDAEEKASDCLLAITAFVTSLGPVSGSSAALALSPPTSTSAGVLPGQQAHQTNDVKKPLDAWIDELDPTSETVIPKPDTSATDNSYHEILLRILCGQDAPKLELFAFDGSPLQWIRFIELFHETVHRQPYFNDTRRMTILQSHLTGRASEIVKGFGCDGRGYALALSGLKSRFGHPALVAKAHLDLVTKGDEIFSGDRNALQTFHIVIRDCLFTLEKLSYYADVNCTETIRQATARLTPELRERWAEHCSTIRVSKREPTLSDLQSWLGDRVSAMFDPLLPSEDDS